jgi:LysR family hydrogen peroxide-inducible transcriptional activator
MNLNQLEYALGLEKYGNFTRTSTHLNISQPALSLQIKNLEEDLGITLFDRAHNPIVPTTEGKKFLEKARELVILKKELGEFAASLKDELEGTIRLGIIPTLSPYLVPLFIPELSAKFPKLTFDIAELLTEEILTLLKRGELDVGIISTPLEHANFVIEPIFYEKFFYYSNHEGTAVDLDSLWLLEEGNCFRDQVDDICALRDQSIKSNLIYRCNAIDSLIRMVDHYGGSTILPELTTLSLPADQEGRINEIGNKVREIGIVYRKSSERKRFIDELKQAIALSIPKRMLDPKGKEIVDPGIQVHA